MSLREGYHGAKSRNKRFSNKTNGTRMLAQVLVWWWMLWTIFCIPVWSITALHPSKVLSERRQGHVRSEVPHPSSVAMEKVGKEEVNDHLYKNGHLDVWHQRKASTVFLVDLFNHLVRGRPLASHRRHSSARTRSGRHDHLPFTDTIRSFSANEVTFSPKKKPMVEFAMPSLPPNERLGSAELRFLHRTDTSKLRRKTRYKLAMTVTRGGRVMKRTVLRERAERQREYHVFDVSRVLHTWINTHHGNITLQVRIPRKLESSIQLGNTSLTSLIALYLEDEDFLKNMYESYTTNKLQPQMLNFHDHTHVKNMSDHDISHLREKRDMTSREIDKYHILDSFQLRDKNPRIKRDSNRRKSKHRKNKRWYRVSKRSKCRMYDFKVDFDFIGWGQWIIHPKEFNSRFCYGRCPSPLESKYKPTNHAMLQTLMREKMPRLAPPTCCVPVSLRPLSMLYFEYDEIVVRHHDDMIADQCGCR